MFNKISEKTYPKKIHGNDWYCEIHICCPWQPTQGSAVRSLLDSTCAAAQIDVTHRPHYRPWSHHSHTPRVEFLPIQIGKIKLLIQLNGRNFHVLTQDAPFVIKLRNKNPGWSRRPCENKARPRRFADFCSGKSDGVRRAGFLWKAFLTQLPSKVNWLLFRFCVCSGSSGSSTHDLSKSYFQ